MEQSEVDSMMQEINKEAGSAPSGQVDYGQYR